MGSLKKPGLIQIYFPGSTSHGQQVASVFENLQSDIQVSGVGSIARVLSGNIQGSRHQRFILNVSRVQTILVAHNIDLPPRIDSLCKGDTVEFYGGYGCNSKGGVLHWIHHDPGR
ncbi:MAG: hypothetical protein ACI808_000104, partial [Paraglaciecola sp.]